MNFLIRLAVVALAACLCLSEGTPDARLLRNKQRSTRGFKTVEMMTARGFGKRDRPTTRAERDVHHSPPERSNRGTPTFKSSNVGFARDFGKRSPEEIEDEDSFLPGPRGLPVTLLVARNYGKRDSNDLESGVYGEDNFLDTLDSLPQKGIADNEDKQFESVPIEWFVNELLNNQEFARSVVKKFIDVNQDGMLSSEELLKNPA